MAWSQILKVGFTYIFVLFALWGSNVVQATAADVDSEGASNHARDATHGPNKMGINADRFMNMDDIFAETIDTDMIETLFNSLGSGVAFDEDISS